MTYESHARNPFMLMLNPEVVFAAMEASDRLKALNSHQCRPLDKVAPAANDDSDGDSDDAQTLRQAN